MKNILLFALTLFSTYSFAIVQIDTSKSNSIGHNLTGEVSIEDETSKSDKSSLKVNTNYKYTNQGNQIIWSQKYDYSEIDNVVNSDDYFSHLRYIQSLNDTSIDSTNDFYLEYFHQYSTYSSRDITYRQLVGSGLRLQLKINLSPKDEPVNTYAVGLGVFIEEDKNSLGLKESAVRLSTYFHYELNMFDNLVFKNTLYWQPAVDDIDNNYRLLNTFSINYTLSENSKLVYYFNTDTYKNNGFSNNVWYKKRSLMLHFKFI